MKTIIATLLFSALAWGQCGPMAPNGTQRGAMDCLGTGTQLQGRAVASTAPTDTYVLTWDAAGATWKPAAAASGNLTATYVIKTADATLPNAQVLGALTTGFVYNTTTAGTGVLSIGVPTIGVQLDSGSVVAMSTLKIVTGTGMSITKSDAGGTSTISLNNTAGLGQNVVYTPCVAASSSGTTYTATCSPVVAALPTGDTALLVSFKADVASTGAATLAIDGLTAKKILKRSGTTLIANDLLANTYYLLLYNPAADSAAGAFTLISNTLHAATHLVSGTDPLVTNSAPVVITNTATTQWVVPAGINHVFVKMSGAGSGGAAGTTNTNGGGGGAAGGYCETSVTVTPGTTITIAIGTAGTGGQTSGANGVAGGNTSFGTLIASGGTIGLAAGPGGTPGFCNLMPTFGMGWNGTTGVLAMDTHGANEPGAKATRFDQGGQGGSGRTGGTGVGANGGTGGIGGSGGGGGANDTGTNTYANSTAGAVGLLGGIGGTGGGSTGGAPQACTAGTAPSGGGGGGAAGTAAFTAGCSGGDGRIELYY